MFKKDLLKEKGFLLQVEAQALVKKCQHILHLWGADLVICGRRLNVLDETAELINQNMMLK